MPIIVRGQHEKYNFSYLNENELGRNHFPFIDQIFYIGHRGVCLQDCNISLCAFSYRLGMTIYKRSDFNLKLCFKNNGKLSQECMRPYWKTSNESLYCYIMLGICMVMGIS